MSSKGKGNENQNVSLFAQLSSSRLSPEDLFRAALVSREWHQASLSCSAVLKKIDFSPFLNLRSPETAVNIVEHRGQGALSINLGYVRLSMDTPLLKFVPYFSNALRSLDVSAVTSKKWVTDEALIAISQQCRNLFKMNIFGCFLVSDHGVRALASRCHGLQVLNLGSCTALTDEAIVAVGTHCPQLLELNLWHLEFVTDRSLLVIAEKCVHMSTLVVSDCKNVSSQALGKFTALCKVYF